MNFGKWIVVSFIVFAAFIATLATICMRQDVPLVSEEYYKEELAYQDQIQRMENAYQLHDRPAISFVNNSLTLEYKQLPEIKQGELRLVRPSDAKLDQVFEVRPIDGTIAEFELKHAVPGMYRAKFTWEQQGKEYFIEKVIVL